MGNGGSCSKDTSLASPKAENGTGNDRFNTLLAQLPKLFSNTTVNGEKWLCTANVTPSFSSVIFACTDAKTLFKKHVSQEKLQKIRDSLDNDHTISWWQFFSALKHAFFNKKVSILIEGDKCELSFELYFSALGRHQFRMALEKVDEPNQLVSQMFLFPMYEFYSVRTEASPADTIDQLEKELKLYKEKLAFLEQEKEQAKQKDNEEPRSNGVSHASSSSPAPPAEQQTVETMTPDGAQQSPVNTNDLVTIPSDRVMRFLKAIKTKLAESNSISEVETDSINSVVKLLGQETLRNLEGYTKKPEKEGIDMEVVTWLKAKFTVEKDITDSARQKSMKEPVQLAPVSKFLENSSMDPSSKTKQDIMSLFDKVDDWNFDVFTLSELTSNQTLFITSYILFVKYDLIDEFNIDERVLINFLREVEAGYHPNPYHNAMHAADVLQVLHFIISKGGLSQYMTKEDILAALLSAIVHDYDHPGLNNAFQVNAQSYLATLYNDRSVLENHHCAQAFELMRSKQYNIFAGMTSEQRKDVRESIIQMVLATDMSQHAKIVGMFKARIDSDSDFTARDDVRLAMQMAIKMADVSNPARPSMLYLKWSERINDEFYRQGDKERELQLPISPLMDRTKPSLARSQQAFMNYIIVPMFETFSTLLPKMNFAIQYINENKSYWDTHDSIEY